MEPDCRLPASSALGTITAFPYLVQTRAPAGLPLVRNGIQYLVNTYDKKLQGWRMLPPEVNHYPRAGWWNYSPESADADVTDHWSNPSACAAAYLHRYATLVPANFLKEVTDKAMSEFEAKKETLDGHYYLPFVSPAEALPPEMSASLWPSLQRQAPAAIVTDPAKWTGYGVRPLWAVSGPASPLMEVLSEAVNAQLDFEIDRQDSDGSWQPFWTWGRYEEEWKNARVEWQGQLTVKLLCSLKALSSNRLKPVPSLLTAARFHAARNYFAFARAGPWSSSFFDTILRTAMRQRSCPNSPLTRCPMEVSGPWGEGQRGHGPLPRGPPARFNTSWNCQSATRIRSFRRAWLISCPPMTRITTPGRETPRTRNI